MNKLISLLLAVVLMLSFGIFALGSGDSEENENQGSGKADTTAVEKSNLGDYLVEIKGCRLAKDYKGEPIAIIKYKFTNNSEDAANFMFAFDDAAYQDGVGLNECLFVSDSAKYSADNQTKDIKKGTSINVEVAYELNNSKSDVEVEVKELISFSDKTISKTFSIK